MSGKIFRPFFLMSGKNCLGKIVARNKNLLQGIIGLAGQFWQTPGNSGSSTNQ
jgi:hypothetical protein